MMREERVAVGEAKTHLSEILDRVQRSAQVVTITRHGRPIARIVPLELVPGPGHLAEAKGWLEEDDAFFGALRSLVSKRSRHRPRALHLEE